MTVGGDAQRSSWIRSDPKISVQALQKPGFGLAWKIKLTSQPIVASTLDRYMGHRGIRSFAFVVGASGELTTIDSDLGRIEWQKRLSDGSMARASVSCPGGMTANVARSVAAVFPVALAASAGGRGRGSPARSGVGQPGEGPVTLAAPAPNAFAGRRPGLGPRMPTVLNAISSDGMFHSMYVSNGEEPAQPMAFLPPNANAGELTVIDGIAYAATSRGCGGAGELSAISNGMWALDLTSKEVAHWTPADDAAVSGFAFGPDSTVYVATSRGDLAALDPKTMQPRNVYRAASQKFTLPPVLFAYKANTLIAAATQDRLHLIDAATFSGIAYPATVTGAMASWQDAAGTRWIVAPSNESITAWRIAGQADAPVPQIGWTAAMASPSAPIVINGVVFAVSNSPSAILRALDAVTGKELWNSGSVMTAAVRDGGLSGSGGQLYLGTSDGTLYAFGFPIEH
jgi:outer membrane protein assembly factor BamB